MLADQIDKPLQGNLFFKFQDEIMNIPEETDMKNMVWNESEKLHSVIKQSSPQECVGISKMRGVTQKSKPGNIRSDDVSRTGPAGGKTS